MAKYVHSSSWQGPRETKSVKGLNPLLGGMGSKAPGFSRGRAAEQSPGAQRLNGWCSSAADRSRQYPKCVGCILRCGWSHHQKLGWEALRCRSVGGEGLRATPRQESAAAGVTPELKLPARDHATESGDGEHLKGASVSHFCSINTSRR